MRGIFLVAGAASFIVAMPAFADVMISTAATSNMSCAEGVCSPTASDAVLNAGDLETLLASSNVTVTTTGANGVQANDISVKSALAWSNATTLTFDASHSIVIDQSVSIAGLSGLSLAINDGGKNGTLSFGERGNISFENLSSVLTINGATFTLVNNITSLARDIAANPSGDFALANNYDAAQDGTYSSSPITTQLTGIVEGLGNTISNLAIHTHHRQPYLILSLFTEVALGGAINNIRLANVSISGGKNTSIGGLVALNSGTLFNDSVSGIVKAGANSFVGGLAGQSNTTINCHSRSTVSGGSFSSVGGLVGLDYGQITDSWAIGHVYVGSIRYDQWGFAGGVVGQAYTTYSGVSIERSFAMGKVIGGSRGYETSVGGLIGGDAPYADETGVPIINSYATSDVTSGSQSWVGGLGGIIRIDKTEGLLRASYATGLVTGGTYSYVGGVSGWVGYEGSTKKIYWDTTTSMTDVGVASGFNEGVEGLTTSQLLSGLPVGFDPKIWAEDPSINNGFPYLIANPPPR